MVPPAAVLAVKIAAICTLIAVTAVAFIPLMVLALMVEPAPVEP